MNREEKYIFSSSTVAIFSSTIAQYTNTNNNTNYLFYANKEKNFLYFKGQSQPIIYVNLTIDGIEINNLLPADGNIFIDITEIIRSMSVDSTHTMQVFVFQGDTSLSLNYSVVSMRGYNYDCLAQTLSLAQGNFCDLGSLASSHYTRKGSESFVFPPTKIIVPLERGLRKFDDVNYIYLPCYNNLNGIANVAIIQGSTILTGFGFNIYNLLSLDLSKLRGLYNTKLDVAGQQINKIILEDFNPAKKYVAVRWAYPYTNAINVGAQGTWAPNFLTSLQFATTFFELAEYEDAQEIIDLEDTGGEMPYLVNSERRCKLRMTNLNAYDYIYYAQILKSEKVEILFNENLSTSNYQPVKLEKSKITLPTNGTELYNLEFNVIISEND
jgi:hypothetical protein